MATTLNAGNATSGAAISADTTGILQLQSGSTPTTAVTIDTSQNVGIANTSPSSLAGNADNLVIGSGSGDFGLTIYGDTSSDGTINFADGTGTPNRGIIQYKHASDALLFGTAATERMRITSAGTICVNATSSPEPNAMYIASPASYAGLLVRSGTDGNYGIKFMNNAGTGVGGIVINASTTTYATSSDYRLKDNIAPMTGALTTVSQLKPVIYDWKTGGSSQGFIAHELQAVVPDCVTGQKDAVDEDGNPQYQGIDTSFLVATLTAAIQELKAQVDAQALEIQALKGTA
jgi:hypothetical protein